MIVVEDGSSDTLPRSIHRVAGRTGQEYDERKNRNGAYWEDRYHATAIETGEHLLRCFTVRDDKWTRNVAVGGEQFIRKIKADLSTKALGWRIREVPGGFELRERVDTYKADFGPKKGDIGLENTYLWNLFE